MNADRDKSERPKWADLLGSAPGMTAEQLFGHERADGNTEYRIVCDECGQIMGLFHKGCDGRWVRESRTVTDWTRTRASERPVDAGTPTGAPAPSQAATEAHSDENEALRGERDQYAVAHALLFAEVERLRGEVARVEKSLRAWQVGPWNGSTRDLLRDLRAALDSPATEEGA